MGEQNQRLTDTIARERGRLGGFIRQRVPDASEAEDILQDAFVKVFTRLGEFRSEGSLEGWIRRIVVTTAINHWQSGKLRRQSQVELPDGFDVAPAVSASALDQLNVLEVLSLIEQLPEGCKVILLLYAVDGYSHNEISEMLGIQESTSKAQLSKARKQLLLLYQQQNNFIRL